VVRFPTGHVVGVDFDRADPKAKWRRVGSFSGTWDRRANRYILRVRRRLIATGDARNHKLSYRIAEERAATVVLIPEYDAASMLETKVAEAPIPIDTESYSPETLLAAFFSHFVVP
jgi:hypothetical protein